MAIKKPFVGIFLFLTLFALLSSVYGRTGYLVNRSLEDRLAALERLEEEKRLEVDALRSRIMLLDEGAALDDLALSLGYNRSGDVVYYFQEADVPEPSRTESDDAVVLEEPYAGVDGWILALISLAVSLAVILIWTVACGLSSGRHVKSREDRRGTGRDYGDFDW